MQRLLYPDMTVSRPFGVCVWMVAIATMMMLLLGVRPTAAQSTGVCALLKPADVTPLIAGTGPAKGMEMGPMCVWNAPGTERYISLVFLPADKPADATALFDRERKQGANDHSFKDEPGLGERAYSINGIFEILKKGRVIRVMYATMDMNRMADAKYMEQVRDAARPVAKKAADAM